MQVAMEVDNFRRDSAVTEKLDKMVAKVNQSDKRIATQSIVQVDALKKSADQPVETVLQRSTIPDTDAQFIFSQLLRNGALGVHVAHLAAVATKHEAECAANQGCAHQTNSASSSCRRENATLLLVRSGAHGVHTLPVRLLVEEE